jgi:hypothetical protein
MQVGSSRRGKRYYKTYSNTEYNRRTYLEDTVEIED